MFSFLQILVLLLISLLLFGNLPKIINDILKIISNFTPNSEDVQKTTDIKSISNSNKSIPKKDSINKKQNK
jgi:Sec-independent protein translocase protein TatA